MRTRYIPSWICTFFSEYKLFVRDCVVEGVYLFSSILHNVASSSTRTSDFIVFINPLIYGTGDFKDHKKHTKDDGGIPPYWKRQKYQDTQILRNKNLNALLVFSQLIFYSHRTAIYPANHSYNTAFFVVFLHGKYMNAWSDLGASMAFVVHLSDVIIQWLTLDHRIRSLTRLSCNGYNRNV